MQISTAGVVVFSRFQVLRDISPLPQVIRPLIAPLWANLNFNESGLVYYRISEDAATLQQVALMIYSVNVELAFFQPTLAVVITWFEAQLFDSSLRVSIPSYIA